MNIAIQVTCLLTEAAEKGVELKVDGDQLKVRTGAEIDDGLRRHLREYQAAIIERLNHDSEHPDSFKDFIHERCLFYVGEGMAIPKKELAEAYQRWAKQNNKPSLSLVSLNKHLRMLGCEEILFQSAPCWEHVF